MTEGRPRIGFIGLGTMGGQMARRLVSQGYTVRGYDTSAERAAQAKAVGVILESSPGHVAAASDVVLSSLPDPAGPRRLSGRVRRARGRACGHDLDRPQHHRSRDLP